MDIRLRVTGGVDKYPAKAHARRIAQKLERDEGFITVAATKARRYPGSMNEKPFRQNRNFFYITGCNEPDCVVSYDISRDRLVLYLPKIDKSRVIWTGRGSTVAEALEKYDIDEAVYLGISADAARDELERGFAATNLNWVGVKLLVEPPFLPSINEIPRTIWGTPSSLREDGRRVCSYYRNRDHNSYAEDGLLTLRAFHSCRVIKDEHEIDLIRQAIKITTDAHVNVMRNLHRCDSEPEVEAAYMQTCIARRAREQAYSPIVGAGPNGATLHYSENLDNFRDAQTLVMDAGCEISCYASDITRTFPLNKQNPGHWPSKEAHEIHTLVEKVQETCIRNLRPGIKFSEITQISHDVTLDGLMALGILAGPRTDIKRAGTLSIFFPHGLGHHIGLEVHDVSTPGASSQSHQYPAPPEDLLPIFQNCGYWKTSSDNDEAHYEPGPLDWETLVPNMVITIEPGIYFNQFLLDELVRRNPRHADFIQHDVLARYMNVGGVRIEDDILITANGYENLTTTPKGDYMLQIIRESAENAAA